MSAPAGSQQPGDSKSTVDKLAEDTKGVGQNVADTASHYTQKTDTDKAGAKAGSIGENIQGTAAHYADKSGASSAGDSLASAGQNVLDTGKHYADKAQDSSSGSTTGDKSYLEQAQDAAANALNTVSKAATDLANSISGSGEQK